MNQHIQEDSGAAEFFEQQFKMVNQSIESIQRALDESTENDKRREIREHKDSRIQRWILLFAMVASIPVFPLLMQLTVEFVRYLLQFCCK